MINFFPERADPQSMLSNQRSIARHVDDDHYVRGFTPGEFALDAAGVTQVNIPVATPRWPALEYADGVLARATVDWRKPSQWRVGKVRARFWYTSPVGSTNNFVVNVRVAAVRDGEVLPGTDLFIIGAAYPGPTVVNTVIRSPYLYATTSLGSDDELFTLQIARDGANAGDTNTNVLQVTYAEVEHIPAVRESQ